MLEPPLYSIQQTSLYRITLLGILAISVMALPVFGGGFNQPVRSSNQLMMANANSTMPSGADIVVSTPAGMMRLEPGRHISFSVAYTGNQFTWTGTHGGNETPEEEHLETSERVGKYNTLTPAGPAPLFQYANIKDKWGWSFTYQALGGPVDWGRDWMGKDLVTELEGWMIGFNFEFARKINDRHSVAAGFTPVIAHNRYLRDGVKANIKNPIFQKALKDFIVDDVLKLGDISIGNLSEVTKNGLEIVFDAIDKVDTPIMDMTSDIRFYGFSQNPFLNGTYNWNISYFGQFANNFFVTSNYVSSTPIRVIGDLDIGLEPRITGLLKLIDSITQFYFNTSFDFELANQRAFVSISLPWHFDINLGWKDDPDNPKVELEVGYGREGFSVFAEQGVELTKPSLAVVIMGFEKDKVGLPLNMQDVDVYHTGMRYHLDEEYAIQGGIEYSTSAVTKEWIHPVAPLVSTFHVGGGVQYKINQSENISFGIGYIYLIPLDNEGCDKEPDSEGILHCVSKQSGVFHQPFNGIYGGFIRGILFQYNAKLDEMCICTSSIAPANIMTGALNPTLPAHPQAGVLDGDIQKENFISYQNDPLYDLPPLVPFV